MEIKCPYCGTDINNDVEQCPNCKEWFKEPQLKDFKLVSIYSYLAFDILLSVFKFHFVYALFWVINNFKNFINLATDKDKKKFIFLLSAFALSVVATIFLKIFIISDVILELFLSYRLLKIIEKFALQKYNSPITHHELGFLCFRTLYVIYFIDTFAEHVKDPDRRYILDVKDWVKYAVMILITLFLLYLIGLISLPFML